MALKYSSVALFRKMLIRRLMGSTAPPAPRLRSTSCPLANVGLRDAHIGQVQGIAHTSPRSDTVDELLQVFRDQGAEIQIGDEEVLIRFTKEALLAAGQGITSNQSKNKEIS